MCFFFFFCVGRVPDPTSHSPPDVILYVNFVAGNNLSFLRPESPSIMVLVFHDFADAYCRTTATYRLPQLSGQIPESSQFLVPVNYPSLNELVSVPELRCIPTQFCFPPNLCLLPLSAMILLFHDLQGALFLFPLGVEEHSEFYSKPEAFGHMSPRCWFSELGPFRLRIFSAQVGN